MFKIIQTHHKGMIMLVVLATSMMTSMVGVAHASVRHMMTPSYDIVIDDNCSQSYIETVCNSVMLTASDKTTGIVEVLRGKKLQPSVLNDAQKKKTLLERVRNFFERIAGGSDKPKPEKASLQKRYIYKFIVPDGSRIITYDAQLLKMQNGKVIFQEKGQWISVGKR